MIFGERVKQARELRGFTQTKLAELLKVTQGRIAQIEGEFRDVADSLIAEIAYHTDLPLSYFSKAPVNRLSAGQAGRLSGERLGQRGRHGRLLRHLLHQERQDHLAVLLCRPVAGQ